MLAYEETNFNSLYIVNLSGQSIKILFDDSYAYVYLFVIYVIMLAVAQTLLCQIIG